MLIRFFPNAIHAKARTIRALAFGAVTSCIWRSPDFPGSDPRHPASRPFSA